MDSLHGQITPTTITDRASNSIMFNTVTSPNNTLLRTIKNFGERAKLITEDNSIVIDIAKEMPKFINNCRAIASDVGESFSIILNGNEINILPTRFNEMADEMEELQTLFGNILQDLAAFTQECITKDLNALRNIYDSYISTYDTNLATYQSIEIAKSSVDAQISQIKYEIGRTTNSVERNNKNRLKGMYETQSYDYQKQMKDYEESLRNSESQIHLFNEFYRENDISYTAKIGVVFMKGQNL